MYIYISSGADVQSLSSPHTVDRPMSEENTLIHLTRTFTSLKVLVPSVSLRMWYTEGNLQFFFTNLPPRKNRNGPAKLTKCKDDQPEDGVPPPPSVKGKDSTDDLHSACLPSEGAEPSQSPTIKKQGGKGRKRRCTASTPENFRDCNSSSSPHISIVEEDRGELSIASIPVSNSFEALSCLNDDEPSNQYDENDDCPTHYQCKRCFHQLQPLNSFDLEKMRMLTEIFYGYCRGKKCIASLLEQPVTKFLKCVCSYDPCVCRDCLTDTNTGVDLEII